MKVKSFVAGGALVLASIVVAFVIAVWALGRQSPPPVVVEQQGVSRFGALHLTEAGGTATPVLRANQTGTGKIVEFLDAGTPVWSLLDGGVVSGGAGQSSTNLVVAGPTAIGTATPAALIDNAGVSNLLEVRDGATPAFTINNGGNWTATGGGTQSNWLAIAVPTAVLTTTPAVQINAVGVSTNILDVQDGGTSELTVLNGGGVEVAAPTAVATAQPALQVDSAGVSNLFEVRAAATPVFYVSNGGGRTGTGGSTQSNWSIVSAPTAIATATPAMVVDSLGVSNILEVRDAATPVVSISNGGNITQSNGDTTLADDFIITAQTAISVADGGVITPTGTYQQLSSAAEITPTVTTTGITAGTLLVLINTTNTTINLADSGTMMLTAAAALGQYDSLTLWFDGTNWIEVSRANN